MDLLHSRRFDGFCLVSSDSDFTRLASRLREEGADVYGFGAQKTPESFRQACRRFIYTENLLPEAAVTTPGEGAPANSLQPASAAIPFLTKAIAQMETEDGWVESRCGRPAPRQHRVGLRPTHLRLPQAQRPDPQDRRLRHGTAGRTDRAHSCQAGSGPLRKAGRPAVAGRGRGRGRGAAAAAPAVTIGLIAKNRSAGPLRSLLLPSRPLSPMCGCRRPLLFSRKFTRLSTLPEAAGPRAHDGESRPRLDPDPRALSPAQQQPQHLRDRRHSRAARRLVGAGLGDARYRLLAGPAAGRRRRRLHGAAVRDPARLRARRLLPPALGQRLDRPHRQRADADALRCLAPHACDPSCQHRQSRQARPRRCRHADGRGISRPLDAGAGCAIVSIAIRWSCSVSDRPICSSCSIACRSA